MPVLMSAATDGAASVDVADSVLAAGATRAGDPPMLTSGFLLTAGTIAVVVIIVLLMAFVAIRIVRHPRSRLQMV